MTKSKMNFVIVIMIVFIAVFFAGSFAYENYIKAKSDSDYEHSLQTDLNESQKENSSGQINDESK